MGSFCGCLNSCDGFVKRPDFLVRLSSAALMRPDFYDTTKIKERPEKIFFRALFG